MELKIAGKQIETPLKPVGAAGEPIELVFLIPRYDGGKDLSAGTVYLMTTQDGATRTHYMNKTVEGNTIRAVWNGSFSSAGTVSIAVKITDMTAELWKSLSTTLTVSEAPAPVMMRAFSMLRTVNPDTEEPITVSERKIIVPDELRNIAVQNDENSETVKIVVPRYFDGHDLDQYTTILKTISSGGRADLTLEKLYSDDTEITFSWTLAPPQTSYSGELKLQIRFVGTGFKWETEEATVRIVESGDAEPVIPSTPSIVDGLIEQVNQYTEEAKGYADDAESAAERAEAAGLNPPKISENETWLIYDVSVGDYVDTGVLAKGSRGDPGSTITGIERTAGNGAPGTIDTYTVTLSDASTYNFQVYNGKDGAGAGDMNSLVYDPQGKATDIFKYVDDKLAGADSNVTADEVTFSDGETFQQKYDSGELTGPSGVTPAFSIGTVETLSSEESATATVTGTTDAPVLNLGIPKGKDGSDATVTVDSEVSSTSENPVQNKAVKAYVDGKIAYGTDDLTAGTSALETGKLYFVYE